MERIVLATHNPGKVRELAARLAGLAVEVVPLADFTQEAAEETLPTFVENALLKARHAARHTGLAAIADDSGLEVDALDGAPGIRSARYAGDRAGDRDNVEKLLAQLREVPEARRTARFQCLLVFLRHPLDPTPLICQGTWEGRIAQAPRGANGFGYDPVFLPAGGHRTAAELAAAEKNRLSHRGQALERLVAALRPRLPASGD
ncbi:MAG: RdgB/HAM1 family non-canonical purine NTP pyrophosphatase [Pseudomonadota bacterium]|nr:RdgB/HAM1 family non-canonical purine NTP pyrophosphatase [Pseudomonadota bacterium]